MENLVQLLKSLQHPHRLGILRMLANRNQITPYTDLLDITDQSTGKLNYHLRTLDGLLTRNESGYELSDFGKRIVEWMNELQTIQTEKHDRPNIVFSDLLPSPDLLRKYFVIISLIGILALLGIGIVALITALWWIFWYLGAAIIISSVFALIFLVYYVSTLRYTITDTEVIAKKGIITKTEKYVPYRTITNIDLKAGVFDRIFNLYTLEIQTAGNSPSKIGPEEKLVGLVEGDEIRETILERIRLLNPPQFAMASRETTSLGSKTLSEIHHEFKSLNQDLQSRNK